MSHNKFLYGENRFNLQEILKFRIQAKLFDEKVTGYIQKFLKKYLIWRAPSLRCLFFSVIMGANWLILSHLSDK